MKGLYLFTIFVFSFCMANANPLFLIVDNNPASQRATAWAGPLSNWGYNGVITQMGALDAPFLSYDVLIISSADSEMTPLRVNNVLQFLYMGKPVYIQCEYNAKRTARIV